MVKSTCFQHTSSHPDKYNNSVNRIISKEEEREDPRRDTSVFFEYSGVSTYNPSILQELQVLQCFHTQSSNSKIFLHTELILPQEILQLQGSSHAHRYKASSSDPSILHGSWLPYSIPGLHGTSRLPANSTRQKQHSKQQPASTQSLQ